MKTARHQVTVENGAVKDGEEKEGQSGFSDPHSSN